MYSISIKIKKEENKPSNYGEWRKRYTKTSLHGQKQHPTLLTQQQIQFPTPHTIKFSSLPGNWLMIEFNWNTNVTFYSNFVRNA